MNVNQAPMDTDLLEDERQVLTLSSGQRVVLADYKKIPQPKCGSDQPRTNGRQTLITSKKQQWPIQRVPTMESQRAPQHDNNVPRSGLLDHFSEPESAKMLIFLQNGEERLITFTLPRESCTLEEILEQVHVPFSKNSHVQCLQNTNSEIDYFVSVGSTTRLEDMVVNHPMFKGSQRSPNISPQPQSNKISTPEKAPCPENSIVHSILNDLVSGIFNKAATKRKITAIMKNDKNKPVEENKKEKKQCSEAVSKDQRVSVALINHLFGFVPVGDMAMVRNALVSVFIKLKPELYREIIVHAQKQVHATRSINNIDWSGLSTDVDICNALWDFNVNSTVIQRLQKDRK